MPSKLIAVSISHHSVPVEYREMVALAPEEIRILLKRLKDSYTDEALVISTCNRSEIYVRPTNDVISSEFLIDLLLESKNVQLQDRELLRSKFERLSYCDAILHLFEVISAIDSQILGDQQIFAQVKDSFRLAEEVGACGTFMTKLAHVAFRVAKRVRNETTITNGAGTISYAAVEFARKVYDDLRGRTVLIVGAGETAELAASYLSERHIGTIILANRTLTNADELANRIRMAADSSVRIRSISLDQIPDIISTVDIVVSSTGSPDLVIKKNDIESALQKRIEPNPIVFMDIAVPRDIDPLIATLPNVFLKDIDDLSAIIDRNLSKRKEEIPKIKLIISEEFEHFLDLFSRLEVGTTIAELRKQFEDIRLEELERNRSKLSENEYEIFDQMTRKMFNRILHTPTVMLKEPRTSKDDLEARIEIVRTLFALDSDKKNQEHK